MNSTSRKVMVVDDEETVRRLMVRILEREGYHVIACSSGTEAVSRFRRSAPSLVLLDLCMSGMDGYRTLGLLKGISPETPVIMMSGYSPEDVEEATGLGADAFLAKPMDVDALLQLVGERVSPKGDVACLC